MSCGKRDAVGAGNLNNKRGGCFRGETMHRLQFHHVMPESANDTPPARSRASCHGKRAQNYDPFRDDKLRRAKKTEHWRQSVEGTARRRGKKRERDNTHRFLRVVRPVTVRHPGGADQLEFSKYGMDQMRRRCAQRQSQNKHQHSAHDETDER